MLIFFGSLDVFSLSPSTDVLLILALCVSPLLMSSVFAFCPIEKECDLNKHLKVRAPERKKLCSRELICNVRFSRCWSAFPV